MNLQDNKFIKEDVARLLIADDWSVVKLALAAPRVLAKYSGIGVTTAKKIIQESQRLVNQEKLNEAVALQPPNVAKVSEEPPASVRVKRLREQNKE